MGIGAGVLAALPAAVAAEVLLFAVIGSLAVLDDVLAATVIAGDDFLSDHSSILSFGLDPLPQNSLGTMGLRPEVKVLSL